MKKGSLLGHTTPYRYYLVHTSKSVPSHSSFGSVSFSEGVRILYTTVQLWGSILVTSRALSNALALRRRGRGKERKIKRNKDLKGKVALEEEKNVQANVMAGGTFTTIIQCLKADPALRKNWAHAEVDWRIPLLIKQSTRTFHAGQRVAPLSSSWSCTFHAEHTTQHHHWVNVSMTLSIESSHALLFLQLCLLIRWRFSCRCFFQLVHLT